MSFFLWYYTKGLGSLAGIAKNLALFVLDFFSVKELFLTLFSPWHRDVGQKFWQGFDPVRFARLFIGNMMSRVIGAIVRFFVIVFGLGVFLGVGTLGCVAVFVWVALPAVFFGCVWMGSVGDAWYWAGAAVAVAVACLSLVAYRDFARSAQENSNRMFRERWFYRALLRVGVPDPEEVMRGVRTREEVVELLKERRIYVEDFSVAVWWERLVAEDRRSKAAFWRVENLRRVRPLASQWRFGFTPHLDRYGYDMALMRGLESVRVCAHPKELESMKMTMTRGDQNCVLLVAPSGSGKRSLVEFLAKEFRERSITVFSPGTRFMRIDLDRVFAEAGKESPRDLVERLCIEATLAGNIVLVLEDVDRYMGEAAQQSGVTDISSILAKYVSVPDFRLIATSTAGGFHTSIERNEGFLKNLEVIDLDPVDDGTALSVLLDAFDTLEENRVVFTIAAFRSAIRHSTRFHPATPLPERALDVANEAILFWQQHPEGVFITEKTIDAFVSFKTGVPLGDIQVSEREKLVRLEQMLAERVIGQPEAVREVAAAMKRARTGMGDGARPIGSFLFLGPTGVGKTELAKTLAKAYFGKAGSLVRIDMSEYQNGTAVERLIGSREQNLPGYLASIVRDTPYGVLLLDELEKADGGVLDLFLQILDEGFFTDAFGQKTMFTNMILIATSNVGSVIIQKRFSEGVSVDEVRKEIIEYVTEKNIFRTEFLNRFDGVVIFRPIENEAIVSVCRILLEELAETIWKNRGVKLEFDESAVQAVANGGYDPLFGARSLKRYIAGMIETKIADALIARNPERGETLRIAKEDIVD